MSVQYYNHDFDLSLKNWGKPVNSQATPNTSSSIKLESGNTRPVEVKTQEIDRKVETIRKELSTAVGDRILWCASCQKWKAIVWNHTVVEKRETGSYFQTFNLYCPTCGKAPTFAEASDKKQLKQNLQDAGYLIDK